MDDIKVYAKDGRQFGKSCHTIRIFSKDTGMEFQIEKCAILKMKRRRFEGSQRIEILNEQTMRAVGKGQWEYWIQTRKQVKK